MTCKSCNTRNPIGNKFCRECGAKLAPPANVLAEEEIARAEAERVAERAGILLTEAFTLIERDRPEAALPLAEEAANLLPHSTHAHSMLALLYEQTGEIDRAISAMERVVAMNPDSAADVHKLEQLKLYAQGEVEESGEAVAEETVEGAEGAGENPAAEGAEEDEEEDAPTLPAPGRVMADKKPAVRPAVRPIGAAAPTLRPTAPRRPTGPMQQPDRKKEESRSLLATWLPVVAAGCVGATVLGIGMAAMRSSAQRGGTQTKQTASADTGTSASTTSGEYVLPPNRDFTPPSTVRDDPFASNGSAKAQAEQAARTPVPPPTPEATPAAPAPQRKVASTTNRSGNGSLPGILGNIANSRPQQQSATIAPAAIPADVVQAARESTSRGAGSLPGIGDAANQQFNVGSNNNSGFGDGQRLAVGPPTGGNGSNVGGSQDGGLTSPSNTGSAGGGYIKITVSPPRPGEGRINATPPPSSDGGSNDADGDDPVRRAQRLQSAGQYRDAAKAYQDAIGRGSDSGETHQGQALAQQRLGDASSARASYRRAIAAYEAQIAAGRNVAAAKRGIDSCKAALEVLGGD